MCVFCFEFQQLDNSWSRPVSSYDVALISSTATHALMCDTSSAVLQRNMLNGEPSRLVGDGDGMLLARRGVLLRPRAVPPSSSWRAQKSASFPAISQHIYFLQKPSMSCFNVSCCLNVAMSQQCLHTLCPFLAAWQSSSNRNIHTDMAEQLQSTKREFCVSVLEAKSYRHTKHLWACIQ